jgi:hypothetical protein
MAGIKRGLAILFFTAAAYAADTAPDQIGYHKAKVDSSGRIVPGARHRNGGLARWRGIAPILSIFVYSE